MEKKQLNLNAPLLSVRKPTSNLGSSLLSSRNSTSNLGVLDGKNKKLMQKSGPMRLNSLPVPKSDWELGEVTKPAAVPFVWEQIPGRVKGDGDDKTETPKQLVRSPRLPPGRLPEVVRRYSGERCNDDKTETPKRSVSSPRLRPGRLPEVVRRHSGERCNDQKVYRPQSEVHPVYDHASLIDSLRESMHGNEESDLESAGDGYLDALDALSPSASFSFNCSVSGLSGCEVPTVKQSGTFGVDPQTRDFMMSRFLPAAKAAVLETPQYTPKKQAVVTEQPKEVRKVVSGQRKALFDQYNFNIIPFYNQYAEDIQSDGDDIEYIEPKKQSGKTWGIFPRLRVKKAFCLLNPIPAMKTRTPVPKSPPTDVGRLTRRAYSGPLDKQAWDPNNKRRFHSGVLSRELHQTENRKSESRQFAYTSSKAGGLSPCRPLRSGAISPFRNASPPSPFSRGVRFLGLPKEADTATAEKYSSLYRKCSNLLDAAPPRIQKQEAVSPQEVTEKTVYIDSITRVNLTKYLASSESKSHANSPGKTSESLAESKRLEDSSPTYSNNQEEKPQYAMKEGTKLVIKSSLLDQGVQPSSTCKSKLRDLADRMDVMQLEKGLSEEASSFAVKNESEAQPDTNSVSLQSPLAPPLPKSPSESWLWRTLPSIHLRIPFSHSHHGKQFSTKVDHKASAAGTKWETIVKTSKQFHDHSHYSEEHFPHVSHKQYKI